MKSRLNVVLHLLAAVSSASLLAASLTSCGKADTAPGPSGVTAPVRDSDGDLVTQTWGPLVVREGEVDEQASTTPWSGSWLPLRSPYLFQSDDGSSAPLQEYDQYMQEVHGQETHAADFEKNDPNLYDPDALGWEGRCDAWATASLLEAEPTQPVTIGDITFSVGDLKSLLTETYENTNALRQFGENFSPGHDFQEMYPDQFQKAVEHELGAHRLMIFDNDPTEQVWNTPLYRAQFDTSADASDTHVMHVTAYIWGVSAFIPDPNYVGTLTVQYTYTYDLYGDPQPDGSLQVVYGEWTGDSKISHPNFVSVLTGDNRHSSNNTQISTDIVNEILAKARAQSPSH